jgi:hypothetical protein
VSCNRSTNLNLARWMKGRHEELANKLSNISNWTYISKMITGQREIPEHTARAIEQALKFPNGWMDRNNIGLIKMSELDFKIYGEIASLPEGRKEGLLKFFC